MEHALIKMQEKVVLDVQKQQMHQEISRQKEMSL